MSVSPRHAMAVWQRNAAMYARTWKSNLLPNFFEPVFYLVSVGIGVGAYVKTMGGVPYVDFLAPGLVCVAAMNGASFESTYNFYIRLAHDRAYDAMLTTPIESDDVLAGETAWAVTRALIYGVCFFAVVALAGLAPLPRALAVLPVVGLTGLLFAALGFAFCVRVPTIELFSYYFTMFLTPLFLFSDVFFPLDERLSPLWRSVAEVLPLLHPVRLARAAFHGGVPAATMAWDVLYIVALSGALLASTRDRLEKLLTS
jgi:lipooligosaccharide transport system permease protein